MITVSDNLLMCLPSRNNLKGSQQQVTLVCFSLFRENRETYNFWQLSKYVDLYCNNEHDMFENSEFRRICNDFTA